MGEDEAGQQFVITGRVQGVGFRPWACALARRLGLTGSVWNHPQGVTIHAFGPAAALDALEAALRAPTLSAARVSRVEATPISFERRASFEIAASTSDGAARLSIPPDLAMCDACRRELLDPGDRRFRYPFINCTQCGPRYTICLDAPYDRSRTTMHKFAMCAECAEEYGDAENRRFHAEPNACPACGPRLFAQWADGRTADGDPLCVAAERLRRGEIVALKGLGGFHLACDARNGAAVRRLRERKHRHEKPLAVMVRDLAGVELFAELRPAEEQLLVDAARPIVLLRRRGGEIPAQEVAPGTRRIGVMLPYTPLHELLLGECGFPLVMTSGNRSEEPIAVANEEALTRLGEIADLFLLHDRDIANRCDDSVAQVVAGREMLLRRARGYVPAAIEVPEATRPMLGCGAHLKNAVCVAGNGQAWLSPHIGDLENDESCTAFDGVVADLSRLLRVVPTAAACDMHPDYYATRYADRFAGERRTAVQHHHAHIAAVCAEYGVRGPVIGLAWDGTGYGADGTAWGGEALFVHGAAHEQIATFRALPLAGGEAAIRNVWRIALAALDDAFGGAAGLEGLALFEAVTPREVEAVRTMIARGLHAPRARGVGRYFDAVGALLLAAVRSGFEGQVAARCGELVDEKAPAYPFEVHDESALCEFDLRATFRALAGDLRGGVAAARIASRFHATLVEVAVAMVGLVRERCGAHPVALGGGCFQNVRLTEDICDRLRPGCEVLVPRAVPPGDGGIALGQVLVAALRGEV